MGPSGLTPFLPQGACPPVAFLSSIPISRVRGCRGFPSPPNLAPPTLPAADSANILHGGGPAGNTTLSFGAGNNLYAAGQLFNSGYTIVARTSNIASPSAMSILFGRHNVLQPWVQARPNAGGDRLYFGFDHLAVTGRSSFGQERRFASHLSIAVDPATSSRVYIAWADLPDGVPPYTLHVRRSDNRGLTWTADLITVTNAANPALAVNNAGKVAFLYQQNTPVGAPLENQKWQTHVRRSANLGGTWDDLVLANTPASQPVAATMPYLGDYVQIQAVGKDFYGIFSASNVPDLAHFPSGVVYQRRADFNTHELKNAAGTAVVAPSIDPFFFRLTEP